MKYTKRWIKTEIKSILSWELARDTLLKYNTIIYNLGEGLKGKISGFENNQFKFTLVKNQVYWDLRSKYHDDFNSYINFSDFLEGLINNRY